MVQQQHPSMAWHPCMAQHKGAAPLSSSAGGHSRLGAAGPPYKPAQAGSLALRALAGPACAATHASMHAHTCTRAHTQTRTRTHISTQARPCDIAWQSVQRVHARRSKPHARTHSDAATLGHKGRKADCFGLTGRQHPKSTSACSSPHALSTPSTEECLRMGASSLRNPPKHGSTPVLPMSGQPSRSVWPLWDPKLQSPRTPTPQDCSSRKQSKKKASAAHAHLMRPCH